MKTDIYEVRSDYYNDEEKCYYIDVWTHSLGDEGFSVAKVYDSPLAVECIDGKELYFSDNIVQQEIVALIKDILKED